MSELLRYRYAALEPVEGRTLHGLLVAYGDTAPNFRERIEPGAFGDVAKVDAILNVQHRRDRPLVRSGAGLTLTDSAEALRVEATLPNTREADDTLELIRAEVLRGFSAEFVPTRVRDAGGVEVVEAATLRGLAVVDRPAYPSARITEVREQAGPQRLRRLWL